MGFEGMGRKPGTDAGWSREAAKSGNHQTKEHGASYRPEKEGLTMEITDVHELDKAEHLDNNIIQAANFAHKAADLVLRARSEMEQISLDVPDDAGELADKLIDQLSDLHDALKNAHDEWLRKSVEYEDAIKAFEAEIKERRAC